jgi:hypothetical protein
VPVYEPCASKLLLNVLLFAILGTGILTFAGRFIFLLISHNCPLDIILCRKENIIQKNIKKLKIRQKREKTTF